MSFPRRRFLTTAAALLCLPFLGAAEIKPKLNVLAAISLRESMAEIAASFEHDHDVDVEFVFGASGQLAAQIENGAPADVFLSASNEHVDRLVTAKLADGQTRQVIATNTLVLVVPASATTPAVTRFEDLGGASVKHLAIGEPKTVPAGAYAMQTLDHLSLSSAVRDRLLFGTNVRQVADYVSRGEAEAGIVYATDAMAVKELKVVASADESWHKPIQYGGVVLTHATDAKLAAAFLDAVESDAGKTMLIAHGFGTPTTQPAH